MNVLFRSSQNDRGYAKTLSANDVRGTVRLAAGT